jgi:hypothetical protein
MCSYMSLFWEYTTATRGAQRVRRLGTSPSVSVGTAGTVAMANCLPFHSRSAIHADARSYSWARGGRVFDFAVGNGTLPTHIRMENGTILDQVVLGRGFDITSLDLPSFQRTIGVITGLHIHNIVPQGRSVRYNTVLAHYHHVIKPLSTIPASCAPQAM